MNMFLYWPYDEVTLETPVSQNVVLVKAPWLEARVLINDKNRNRLEHLVAKFASQTLSSEDLPLINWLFQELSRYPLGYIVPMLKAAEPLDHHPLKDQDFLSASFSDFLAMSLIAEGPLSELSATDAHLLMAKLDRKAWAWDAEAALAFAQVQGGVHPESLFTVTRRYHLLDVLERDEGHKNFDFIQGLSGDAFTLAASILVRQNHYVTQKCQDSLLPALETAASARRLVEDFVKEESGHDRILNVAMKALTAKPDEVPVSLQTKAIMHLLKFAAHRNFLAFAMAVDFFERSAYERMDPLAQLLLKGGFGTAAKQINRHMEINDAGGHENVACSFLQPMAPCDPAYAREALRIAEMISLMMNGVTASAVELYHQAKTRY